MCFQTLQSSKLFEVLNESQAEVLAGGGELEQDTLELAHKVILDAQKGPQSQVSKDAFYVDWTWDGIPVV